MFNRGHYRTPTQTMRYLRGTPLKFTIHLLCINFDSPQIGNLMIPVEHSSTIVSLKVHLLFTASTRYSTPIMFNIFSTVQLKIVSWRFGDSELKNHFQLQKYHNQKNLPSRELTYPTWGKGKSSSKCHFCGDMLVPRRVSFQSHANNIKESASSLHKILPLNKISSYTPPETNIGIASWQVLLVC